MTRRRVLLRAAGLGIASALPSWSTAQEPLIAKPIPRSGELLPAVGLGTASVFDVGNDPARLAALAQVVRELVAGGGSVIDTASSYGTAESVVGQLVAQAGLRSKVFIATKLEQPDAAELRESLRRLRTDRVDLLQLHNVSDAGQSLAPFRQWQADGLCRYVGITSTFRRDYAAVEAVLRKEKPDFLQIDYSVDNRAAEARLLPLAAETRTAVLTALPFGRGRLFRSVRGKALPEWAQEFDARTWAQFFLKFLLGHPAVTAVIPGTGDADHMKDNLGAMRGRLPDAAQRRRMVDYLQSL
ncbi:MAG: aldo/keto reductase [Rhodocyclaceae bacterium]|nr:aldo/keto reductase [Rhodocyclaceae bacterium]